MSDSDLAKFIPKLGDWIAKTEKEKKERQCGGTKMLAKNVGSSRLD